MLEVQHLYKRYGTRLAVRDLSFTVGQGEVYGLLGPNGAGKSTTFKMLSCLLKPDQGEMLVDGVSGIRRPDRVKPWIGVVPQDIALYEELSARENLEFFGQLYGLPKKVVKERALGLLEEVGLLERANERVGGFSGGMKRRVNIAAGLVHGPRLLYLDEPTVGIDPQSRRLILDLVHRLKSHNVTVVYTTHYMEEAEELCDRIAVIDHGQIIAAGTLGQLRELAGELASITIHVHGEPSEEHLAELSTLVETLNYSDETLELLARDAQRILPEVLRTLARFELYVHHLEIAEPNLETVFLRLTGRSLRDD